MAILTCNLSRLYRRGYYSRRHRCSRLEWRLSILLEQLSQKVSISLIRLESHIPGIKLVAHKRGSSPNSPDSSHPMGLK